MKGGCELRRNLADKLEALYLLFPRPTGGVYVFSTSEVSDGTADNAQGAPTQNAGVNAETTTGRLMEASIRVLGR
jgi:hypothetical protein